MERRGKMESDQSILSSTSAAHPERLTDSQEESFAEAEQLDTKAIKGEKWKELHLAIEEGDIVLVRKIADSHGQEKYFSYNKTSALYKAALCENNEIIAFLTRKGAKIHNTESIEYSRRGKDLVRNNDHLSHYNDSIYKLFFSSFSSQTFNRNQIIYMYEELFEHDTIKLLMNVLGSHDFDIEYNFETDYLRSSREDNQCKVFGMTLLNSKEILVGAKNLLSDDQKKKKKVYGVVAEELCHLALEIVFDNDGKPYINGDSDLCNEFKRILDDVKSLTEESHDVEFQIQNVFTYEPIYQESELIARVPHLVGIYGEKSGKKKFQEHPKLLQLLDFYEKNVHEELKKYTDLTPNRDRRILKRILNRDDFISIKERRTPPLKEGFGSFKKYLVVTEDISIMTTNCIKVCTLHVYYELSREFKGRLEMCLFFGGERFLKNRIEILNTLSGESWKYLILVIDEKNLNTCSLQKEYIDPLKDFANKGKIIILISSFQNLEEKFKSKLLNYKWNDLSEEYKALCIWPMKYIFKGERDSEYLDEKKVHDYFGEEDLITIMNRDPILVEDGANQYLEGFNPETYIERQFQATVISKDFLHKLPTEINILLSVLEKEEHEELPFHEEEMQRIKGSHDKIQSNKSIFVVYTEMSLEKFRNEIPNKRWIWLHYYRKEFYVRNIDSCGDIFIHHLQPKPVSEEEILNFLKWERTLIISDNAGYGKSTVISSLIDNVKKKNYRSWNLKYNFNQFTGDEAESLSIDNAKVESAKVFLMIGLKNGFETHLFKKFNSEMHRFIFFDGFDEIPEKNSEKFSEYKNGALKLLSTVRKETAVNMIISTRKHHQKELEKRFNTYSHQLVPLSREDQVRYLDKMWKSKLKYPNGKNASQNSSKKKVSERIENIIKELKNSMNLDMELIPELEKIKSDSLDCMREGIDRLNFNKAAEHLIKKTSMDKDLLEFMGIPLHLFMVGSIYYDNNFNLGIDSDFYGIYSEFIKQKVKIYVEDKQNFKSGGTLKDETLRKKKKKAYKICMELANQVMKSGKIDSKKQDLELCSALGVVSIKGGEIDFLHHTFAEFFRAESIRKSKNKDDFIDMLFDDGYYVVRRFFFCFEKDAFKDLKTQISKDVNSLITILKKLVNKSPSLDDGFYNYESNFDFSCVTKILKELLKSVHSDLLHDFFDKLDSESLSLPNWYLIGGCVPFEMLKLLLNRNFEVHRKMILGIVRYYVNPEEVIAVLRECMSIQTGGVGQSSSSEQETGEKVKKDSQSLLNLFNIEDSERNGLFHYALWNERPTIFAKVLMLFYHELKKERFTIAIALHNVYRKPMEKFITKFQSKRIAELLKELKCTFGKEINVVFDNDLQFMTVKRAFSVRDEMGNSFEEVIGSLVDHFGIENFEKVLQHRGSDGNCLIHSLISENKNVIENLNIIRDKLGDRGKMKQFLMSEDDKSRNMFHLSASTYSFEDYLRFCSDYLKEEDDFRIMLLSFDIYDENTLHILFKDTSSETIISKLMILKQTLADDGFFNNFLESRDKKSCNMLHLAASNRSICFRDILELCCRNLEPSKIKGMLSCRNQYSQNVLDLLFENVILATQ